MGGATRKMHERQRDGAVVTLSRGVQLLHARRHEPLHHSCVFGYYL